MFRCLFLFILTLPLSAEHTLFACVMNAATYVVGAKLPPSGVFRKLPSGEWQHVGFNHPFTSALAYDAADPATLYLAAGNGLIRLANRGEQWKILTGSDVTELRDVATDPHVSGSLYFAHTRGIANSVDSGKTWHDASGDLKRRYAETVRVDREYAGVLIAGTESGVFRSEDRGGHWRLSGAAGFQILRLEQSPFDSCFWLAATQQGGLFSSSDCGRSFENTGGALALNRNLYEVAWDPHHLGRVAVAGFAFGIAISRDQGITWTFHNRGLPRVDVWCLAFDPDHAGRIYASVNEEAVYVSNDDGETWTPDGLPGKAARRLVFIPEAARSAR
ncbi:MAG: glycoside hydrolase [Acidobacteriota bacterium]|nr:glycoside hydrolase [Acidobacteriota bacterium]